MKKTFFTWTLGLLIVLPGFFVAGRASGHGFELTLHTDGSGNPTNITEQLTLPSPLVDQNGVPIGPNNLFIDEFGESIAGGIGSDEGFAKAAHNFPADATYTFNITSPLYFSSGAGARTAYVDPSNPQHLSTMPDASEYIQIYDLAVVSDSRAYVYGNRSSGAGFAVTGNGTNPSAEHELQKILFNAQAEGEYGFAFNVTAHFSNGASVTSDPLVDVFATPDFTDDATQQLQDAATLAIYGAIMQGDFNLDGQKTVADVSAMMKALSDLQGYRTSHDNMVDLELAAIGDVNGNGVVNNGDIQALICLLANNAAAPQGASPIQAVPEPSTLALLFAAIAIFVWCWWRNGLRFG